MGYVIRKPVAFCTFNHIQLDAGKTVSTKSDQCSCCTLGAIHRPHTEVYNQEWPGFSESMKGVLITMLV